MWANFQRIMKLFTQKIVNKLSKIWVWDPGSGSEIRKKPIPDPGSKGQKGTGSRIRNTADETRADLKLASDEYDNDFWMIMERNKKIKMERHSNHMEKQQQTIGRTTTTTERVDHSPTWRSRHDTPPQVPK